MRSLPRFLGFFLFLAVVTSASAQAKRTQFRPAVLGSGPDSLVNRIDTADLVKKGQKAGAVMFCAAVSPNGQALYAWTYRPMPGTEPLQEELKKRLEDVKFTPAIYQYQPVGVLLYGTAIFNPEGANKIRIFLNQDPNEIRQASDFIAPQPVIGADSKFDGLNPPADENPIPLTAVVDLRLKINRDGILEEMQVIKEEPPLLGYGAAAVEDFRAAKFIPAFRLGDRAPCEVIQPVCYKPVDD